MEEIIIESLLLIIGVVLFELDCKRKHLIVIGNDDTLNEEQHETGRGLFCNME